jgi:ribosomal protein S18 acetylase RimI-like enzyme
MSDNKLMPFDTKYLLGNPRHLQQLCELYCEVFGLDPFFREYRRCSKCGNQYSFDEVLKQSTEHCTCGGELCPVWFSTAVAVDLIDVSKHHSFSGAIYLNDNGDILGFSWGRLYSREETLTRWVRTEEVLNALSPDPYIFHLHELAVAPSARGKGIGKKLALKVLTKPYLSYPNVPATLSTHQDSPAVKLYESIGFATLCDKPDSPGIIRMGIGHVMSVKMFGR